ncbi:MAG TPA: DUF433 domain-containing protein [Thermoanaerobaculia bacterium]|nr:DUF433 domain-containing protein [Thermoanaerobaculia bacterium]
MILPLEADPVPLTADAHGALRIARTRVTLDTVLSLYRAGATPEEISDDFPSLELADIFAVITYYLRHRPEVEAYLEQGRREAEILLLEDEARFGSGRELKERLLARLRDRQT